MKLAKTPGRSPVFDWLTLRNEYEASGIKFLRTWCATKIIDGKPLNYTYASKQFSEIARLEESEDVALARRKLARFAPNAAEKIGNLVDSEDENVALKASTAIVDRVGLNPQAAIINVQNTNAVGVIIPPMFSDDSRADLKEMLQGDED